MTITTVLLTSITLRALSVLLAIVLLVRIRDWRMGFLALLMGLMGYRQILTFYHILALEPGLTPPASTELPGLAVSVMAFLMVVSLDRLLVQNQRGQKKLEESEQHYRQLFESSPDAIFIMDTTGHFLDCNKVAVTRYGYTRDELLQMIPKDLAAPDFREKAVGHVKQALESGATFEWRHKCKDGLEIPVEISAVPIVLAGKKCILSSVRDITERKQAERKAIEQSQQLVNIYNTVGDVIYHLSVEPGEVYRFYSVNEAFSKITGIPKEAVLGKTVSEIIPEPSLTMVLGKYKQAIAEKSIVRWEETSEYPTGNLTGEVSIAPIFDENNNCTYLVGSVHDITERKLAEEKLKRQLDELKRWQTVTLDREYRFRELKLEINALLKQLGKPARYSSVEDDDE